MVDDFDETHPFDVWKKALLKFGAPLKIFITLTEEKKQLVMVDRRFSVEGSEIQGDYGPAGHETFKNLKGQFGAVAAEWPGHRETFGTYAEFSKRLRRL